ncbi:hypothetical protein [Luteimonas yindakuii]|uniref:hypothetical protein n=1 Tax=Luteimonas yindakuii TaxID=2565782 RepID=UPI0010A3DF67|nr:hypothetical protein [Luteimonas yindakuii]
MDTNALLLPALLSLSAATAAAAGTRPPHGHIEFLWEARDPATQARPVALGLLLHPERPHQLCWKSSRFPDGTVSVRLLAKRDATKVALVEETVTAAAPIVRCHPFEPARHGLAAGEYEIVLTYDDIEVAREPVEIAADLASAGFHRRDAVFVQGRTNYPAGVAPEDYRGHFLWTLTFGADGRVIDVDTVEAEGIAASMREAGDQAARLYRIGAADEPGAAPVRYRLRYDLMP